MGKMKIEVNVPDNLEQLIESLAKFLHKKPEDLISKIALEALKAPLLGHQLSFSASSLLSLIETSRETTQRQKGFSTKAKILP